MVTMTMIMILILIALLSHVQGTLADTVCACGGELPPRPDVAAKAATARWMARSLDWGVLSTISSRLGGSGDDDSPPVPFGNVYSFVDGTCDKSTGIPYIYGTYLDQTFLDSKRNPIVSLTLSDASFSSVCPGREGLSSCQLGSRYGDPENPVCARVTLTGELVVLDDASEEYAFAQQALFERHSTMESWPAGHKWVVAKIELQDIWLIDFFGGAAIIKPDEYLGVSLLPSESEEEVGA